MSKLRKIEIDGDFAYVPLTQGKFSIIDSCDYEKVCNYNWYARYDGWNWYARRNRLASECAGPYTIHMHRVLTGVVDGMYVDHIDGDGLNNTRENMRISTHSENLRNRDKQSNNTSGKTGVSWHKQRMKWQVNIGFEGKSIYLGLHERIEDAYDVYRMASKKYHREFSRIP